MVKKQFIVKHEAHIEAESNHVAAMMYAEMYGRKGQTIDVEAIEAESDGAWQTFYVENCNE